MRPEKSFKHNYHRSRSRLVPFASVLLFSLLVSCEDKPDLIGHELLPSGDNFSVSFDSTELVYGYSVYADSIRAGYKANHLLGSISDPFFGSSKAEILTTISSSLSSKGFGANAVADSVILFLSWSERIGEGELPLPLHLYEFNEFLRFDSAYYSNMDMTGKYREPALGSSFVSIGDTLAKIYITDQEFIDKFLKADDSILRKSDYIQELMYGLYLTTDDPGDEGVILNINFDDPYNYLYFYYSNDTLDSLNQLYLLSNNANGRVNMFRHNTSGYPLEEYIQNGSDNDSILFVQSMAGINSIIRFPELASWLDSMPVAINEARLILTMADTGLTMQSSKYFPESLELYLIHEDGSFARVYDNILDATGFGGTFDEITQSYGFTIKVHLQSILAENIGNLEMMIAPGNTAEKVSRAGLYGWNAGDHRKSIRLEIIYTLL